MDLPTLAMFRTVAAEKSFSRAAVKLGRTQPAVSLAVQRLEQALGEPLIDRSGRHLRLTDAGQIVFDHARRFENLRAELVQALAELRDKATGRPFYYFAYGAACSEVTVDTMTGEMKVDRVDILHDVGKSLNPAIDIGQIEGGFVQGMSTALFEGLKLENGVLRNPSFVDYRIASSADAPAEHRAIIVEVPQDDGPWGARGVGEHPMVPTIPAVANAIYDAIGVRPESPPFTSEKVYLAMLDAGIVE